MALLTPRPASVSPVCPARRKLSGSWDSGRGAAPEVQPGQSGSRARPQRRGAGRDGARRRPRGGAGGARGGRAGRRRGRGSAGDGPAARLAALLAVLALGGEDPARAAGREDTFSALTCVARALAPERRLLGLLRRYLRGEEARLRDLTRFYDKVLSLHEDSAAPVANPLLAFTLIKRLQSDWRNVVHSLEASENIQALKDGYEKVEQDLPVFEDLEGAARALMRLQDVYMLNVKGLARGVFQRVTGSDVTDLYSPRRTFSLTADDCFQVGKVAYDMGDYYHAIPWLEEAVSLFRGSYGEWKTEDEASLEDALDHLAFACFQAGNVSCALSLSREFLLYSPENKRMARNVLKYERLLAENPQQDVAEAVIQRPQVPYLRTRDTYEGLCQTLGSQPIHYQIPSLYCSYETNSSPYLLLQPIRKEVIHLEPYVALYHDFVSDSEAQKIRELAEPWLQRSVVASGEKQLQVEYRISKSAWLKDTVDPMLVTLDHRIAALTGLDVQPPYAEYLQVVNYGIGGHYEPHFDHATLSSVEAGGATAFIYANFSMPVVKNAALFWWNLHRSGEGDGDTLHAGCPVLVGDKWVANKWIHEYGQEFRRPCSPNPEH